MDLGDYLTSSRPQSNYPSTFLSLVKYILLVILLLSSLYLFTIISVFLFNQDSWIKSMTSQSLSGDNPSALISSVSIVDVYEPIPSVLGPISSQINVEIQLFEIKSALTLVYLAIGFISILSEDYYISLFFAFSSIIGFLFSLVKHHSELQIESIIYSILVSLLSMIHCVLLRFSSKTKSPYFYGYMQP